MNPWYTFKPRCFMPSNATSYSKQYGAKGLKHRSYYSNSDQPTSYVPYLYQLKVRHTSTLCKELLQFSKKVEDHSRCLKKNLYNAKSLSSTHRSRRWMYITQCGTSKIITLHCRQLQFIRSSFISRFLVNYEEVICGIRV